MTSTTSAARGLRSVVCLAATTVDPAPDAPTEPAVWTPQQLRRFLAHTDGTALQPLWVVAAGTGMRRGE